MKFASLFVLAASLFLAGNASAATLDSFNGQSGTLDIAGGTAHIPVMKSAAQAIMSAHPEIRITIAGGGSGVGVQKVGEGLVNIGNTGRPLKEKEIAKYGLQSFAFAIDGVAVAVNPANPVSALTRADLLAVLSGKITNWKELGGKDAAITVYGREDGSGTREVFEKKALGTTSLQYTKTNIVNSNGAMKTAVAQDPNALGYVGIGHIDAKIKGIVFEGVEASQQNAANGSYSVTRKLYMNTKGAPEGLTKTFIEYVRSADGEAFTAKAGYIPCK